MRKTKREISPFPRVLRSKDGRSNESRSLRSVTRRFYRRFSSNTETFANDLHNNCCRCCSGQRQWLQWPRLSRSTCAKPNSKRAAFFRSGADTHTHANSCGESNPHGDSSTNART